MQQEYARTDPTKWTKLFCLECEVFFCVLGVRSVSIVVKIVYLGTNMACIQSKHNYIYYSYRWYTSQKLHVSASILAIFRLYLFLI